MSDLKPCPFCGGRAHLVVSEDDGGYRAIVYCTSGAEIGCFTKMSHWALKKAWVIKSVTEAWNRRAQPANEPLTKISEMLEQAAQDMDDKCRQWQCVLQRVHDAGTFDQNSGLWVGIDKEREAKAQASFEAYRYALEVIDKIAEHVSNPYKSAHKLGGEQE